VFTVVAGGGRGFEGIAWRFGGNPRRRRSGFGGGGVGFSGCFRVHGFADFGDALGEGFHRRPGVGILRDDDEEFLFALLAGGGVAAGFGAANGHEEFAVGACDCHGVFLWFFGYCALGRCDVQRNWAGGGSQLWISDLGVEGGPDEATDFADCTDF